MNQVIIYTSQKKVNLNNNYTDYIGNLRDNLINNMMAKNPENNKQLRDMYEEELARHEKKDNSLQSKSFLGNQLLKK